MSNSRISPYSTVSNLNKLYLYSNSHGNYLNSILNLIHLPYFLNRYMSGLYMSFIVVNYPTLTWISPFVKSPKSTSFLFSQQSRKTNKFMLRFKMLTSLSSTSRQLQSRQHPTLADRKSKYTYNPYFLFYKKHFNSVMVPLFSPFIKKKTRTFPFSSKLFNSKMIKSNRLNKKIFAHRKLWFLHTLLNLNKKIKLINFVKTTNIRRFMRTLRLKKEGTTKRKIHLIPRQHLFLNGSRITLKGKKPIKTLLLRRMVRFYRRKLRRMDISTFSVNLKQKNLKYKLHLLKLVKRSDSFLSQTLLDVKFTTPNLTMMRVIRRGKSRLKLRRTKKYYSQLISIVSGSTKDLLLSNVRKYYRFARVRYLNRFFRNHARRYKLHLVGTFDSILYSPSTLTSCTTYSENMGLNTYVHEYVGLMYLGSQHKFACRTQSFFSQFQNWFTTTFKVFGQTTQPFTKMFNSTDAVTTTPTIWGKYRTPFILSTVGFVFIQSISTQTSSYVKSTLNRFRYSFFFKKDLKRYLLKKPGRLKLLTSTSLFTNYKNRDNKPFLTRTSSNWTNLSVNKDSLYLTPSVNSLLTSQNPFFSYKYPRRHDTTLNTFFKKEVRIKRIKFKPGYSRIWRSAREALNTALNLNIRYQYRLTRHLNRIQRLTKQTQAYIFDLTLKNILLNSHFVRDHSSSLLMISHGLVFVNGTQTFNPNLNLFQNDFIQIIVSLKYYIVLRWLINWNSAKRIRLRKLSKTKFKKFKMTVNKQRSQNLPDWVLNSRLKLFDIPKYLEVDFFTLSSFVLYEPFLANDLNSLNFLEARSEILNMYNWKYIN